MCPRCHQDSPLVYRGLSAYCSACGAPRLPFANQSLTHAGQPAKVGGTITRVLGWLVLGGGGAVAALFAGLLALLSAPLESMLVVSGTIAVVAAVIAFFLLRGGKRLQQAGDDTELAARRQAIFALAQNRAGTLTPSVVAHHLHVSVEEGDAILTQLAKTRPDQVTVDLDDEGNVLYRFGEQRLASLAPNDPRVWTRASAPPPPRVQARVADGEQVRVGPPSVDDSDEAYDVAEPARHRAR